MQKSHLLPLSNRSREEPSATAAGYLFTPVSTSRCTFTSYSVQLAVPFFFFFRCGALTMVQDLWCSIMKRQHIQHISPETASARCKTIIECRRIHHNYIQIWSRGAGGHAGTYMCRVLVARQFCHNTPVTFRPCQVWCYCPRLTLVCERVRKCVI